MAAKTSTFSAKEFLSKLGKDEFDNSFSLTGMAKAGEASGSEFPFVVGSRCGNWTPVPIDVVEHVEVHGSVPCDDHLHQRVTLTFKTPKSPEAAAYAALLATAVRQQRGGKRVVHKGGGSEPRPATFAACGCSEVEIDASGHVWTLMSVTKFEDGSCICDYA